MDKLPLLYSFRRCPYAMRARLAIHASGAKVELREVVLRDKPQEMIDISAKATVPVLQLPDGKVIEESLEVMDWALECDDPDGLLGHRDGNLIAVNDGPFKTALDHYKYPTRYDLDDIAAPRQAGLEHLQDIDARLSRQSYLAGAKPGYTDYALMPFIRQFSMVDAKWFSAQDLPALKPWLKTLMESHTFLSIMHKYPQWKPGDAPVSFPPNEP